MGKSWDSLKKRLSAVFESHGTIAAFCRQTGLARSGVDQWFDKKNPTSPRIESLDAIAEAIGVKPWDAIKPENESGVPTIPLKEHLAAIEALQQTISRLNELNEHHTKEISEFRKSKGTAEKAKLQHMDPGIYDLWSVLESLNKSQREEFLATTQARLTLFQKEKKKSSI